MSDPQKTIRPSCVICRSRESKPVYPRSVVPWVVRCESCGLKFASPQPSEAELGELYGPDYYEQFGFSGDSGPETALAVTKRQTYQRMLRRAEPHIRSGGKRLLDVGCGLGFSLLTAGEAGFEAVGLDPLGKPRPGRHILRGHLESVERHDWDVISLIDVIEHVRDPSKTLRQAYKRLAPGGVLIVATCDGTSVGERVLGPRWTHYHRAHLWFFSREQLSHVATDVGFEVIESTQAGRVYNLEYIASILARGANFALAKTAASVALRIAPRAALQRPWPAVPEGLLLVARRN